jgi:hypothetical protein
MMGIVRPGPDPATVGNYALETGTTPARTHHLRELFDKLSPDTRSKVRAGAPEASYADDQWSSAPVVFIDAAGRRAFGIRGRALVEADRPVSGPATAAVAAE